MSDYKLLTNFKILGKPFPTGGEKLFKKVALNDTVEGTDGTVYTIDNDCFYTPRGSQPKEIQLIPAFVKALELIVSGNGAIGLQTANNNVNYVVTEVLNESLNKIVATAYAPHRGSFKQCSKKPNTKKIEGALVVDGTTSCGEELWFTLIASLLNADKIGGNFEAYTSTLYPKFVSCFDLLKNESNIYNNPLALYKLQDMLTVGIMSSSVPYQEQPNSAAPPAISLPNIKSGTYEPTQVLEGKFLVLSYSDEKVSKTVAEVGDKYKLDVDLTDEEKLLIPNCDNKTVSSDALSILNVLKKTPMKTFMLSGPAGTGKTTDCKVIAALLGLPYRLYTCSDGTDEMDIVSKMIPNTKGVKDTISQDLLKRVYNALVMDPATALYEFTGEYKAGISGEEALGQIMDYLVSKQMDNKKDFIMVPSQIVEGVKRPAVVEIQEAALISKPGVLPTLNSLLDDEEIVTLTDGTVIHKDPNSIFIFTTNRDYKGCKDFNESVKSRMNLIIDSEDLGENGMVERLMSKDTIQLIKDNEMDVSKARDMAKAMAKVMLKLRNYLKEQMITGGVCGYREYANWFYLYLVTQDAREAAMQTIVTHITSDPELKLAIQQQVLTGIPEE